MRNLIEGSRCEKEQLWLTRPVLNRNDVFDGLGQIPITVAKDYDELVKALKDCVTYDIPLPEECLQQLRSITEDQWLL